MRAAIFVIDDNLAAANMVARLFRAHGHDVLVETNGPRALAVLLSEAQFDVTFLDLLMPDVTGGEIYQQLVLRAPGRLRRLVFLTGAAHLVPTWLRSTGLPVIDKPASGEILEKTVQDFAVLTCSRGPQPMPKKPSHPDLIDLIGDDDDDEDDSDDTGVFEETLRTHKNSDPPDGSKDTVIFAAVKYSVKKSRKVSKRVRELENWKNRITWIAIGLGMGTGGITVALWKAIEKILGH